MTNFYSSGLYTEPFYTKHKHVHDLICNNDNMSENLKYDHDLYIQYFCDNQKELFDQAEVFNMVLEDIACWTIYFEPLVFEEKTALKCSLTPFTFKEVNYLALGGCGMDLTPKLDAYQALTHNSIDKNSLFFSRHDYFCHVVGVTISKEILAAIQ
jgi:hypothetical protein